MSHRYCFIVDNPHWEDQIKKIYKDIDVVVSKLSADEGCVILNNEKDREAFLASNERVSRSPGFSRPIFVPKWKKIVNNGPYVTEDQYKLINESITLWKSQPHRKRAGVKDEISLDKVGEQALYSYDKDNTSSSYHENFKTDFKRITGYNITDIDLSTLKPPQKLAAPDISKYGFVSIDGQETPLVTFATPPTTVNEQGHILPGVTKRDIVLNSEKAIPGFKTIFVPGASWSAKWNTPSYKGRTFIDFKHDEELEEEEELMLSEPSLSSEASQISEYPESEQEEEEEEFIPQKPGKYMGPLARIPFGQMEEIVLSETDKPDFAHLSDQEKTFLPLAYILSQSTQWRIVLKAITSNFTIVSDLPKVNDYVLELIADSIAYSISKGISPLPSAIAILKYAEKRGV